MNLLKSIAASVVLAASTLTVANPANACWACGVRDRAVNSVRTEAGRANNTIYNGTRSRSYNRLYLKNVGRYTKSAALQYRTIGGSWVTKCWTLDTSGSIYVADSKNRIFYVGVANTCKKARSRAKGNSGSRTRMDSGSQWTDFTVRVR